MDPPRTEWRSSLPLALAAEGLTVCAVGLLLVSGPRPELAFRAAAVTAALALALLALAERPVGRLDRTMAVAIGLVDVLILGRLAVDPFR